MGPLGGVPRQRSGGHDSAASAPRPARRGCPASAVLLLVLVVAQLASYVTTGSGERWVGALALTVCALALPLGWGLWTGRMCESRFFAVLVAACVAGAHVLAATVGPPGGAPLGWTTGRVLLVVLAVGVAVLVPWRARALTRGATREGGTSGSPDPYASADVGDVADGARGTAAAGRGGRRRDRRAPAADVGA